LAFVEEKVRIDALYRNLDEGHVVRFSPSDPRSALWVARAKMARLREERNRYRSQKTWHEVIDFAKTTCTVAVGFEILDYFVNKKGSSSEE
jgi:hypothetical protein